ncbi:DOMON domain protein [Dictyocaulus viviparus]|uniref:DOMON domain protein n=1 Tax=Dictyocaulus viviparus TaxID=29172 RepID=A0A0D8XY29_DICVI|nr:DOMON domain protein [Dictyocaulus viviparus]
MPWWALFVVLLLVVVVERCTGHVRLTFPPARYPDSDYYSSYNSKPPCGVSKPPLGAGLRTFLKTGSTIDLQWSSAIPHMGGIRVEVLNSVDEPIAIFTNFPDPYNITETEKRISLPPGFECSDCAIRITRQATEYGNDYFFYSCADVNILKEIPDGDTCLSRGTRKNGICHCEENFFGDYCQFKAECSNDDECGVNGLCHTSTTGDERQCFCPGGRFGEKCQRESTTIRSASEFDETLYNLKEVEDNKIYWRILNDEIEMVLRYPGESWVAIGWKPQHAVCPELPAQLELPDDDCGPNEQWTSCPEMSRDCEPSCDWTRFPETIPNCPRSCGAARCVCKEGFVRMNNDDGTCVPFEFCDKEAQPSCPTNSTWAKCGVACEPSCANMYDTAPCPATCEKSACTCADNYVRHEGKCIYWGDCPDFRPTDLDSHFHEEVNTKDITNIHQAPAVTVDIPLQTRTNPPRTSPPRTTTKPSLENLTCAVNETIAECGRVCEADCVSIFTRADCDECGTPACTCMQGYARNPQGVCVYWGDCPIDVGGDVCYGDFRFPTGCTDCDYKLSWNYVDESDEIEFSLETKLQSNSWTGLGLSKDGSMITNVDMLVVKSVDGVLSLHDMFTNDNGILTEDPQQDLYTPNVIGTHANGILRAQFMRKRNTEDKNDISYHNECWKMIFPVYGGKLDENENITADIDTPLVSEKEVCIRSCREQKKDSDNSICENSYRYPANCTGDECEYIASWIYDSTKDDVRFEISSRNIGRWTGIGFSKDGQMTNSDIYTGWVFEGKAFVTDRFAYGRQLPAIDPADRNNIYDIGGKIEDETQTFWFRRAVHSKDLLTDFPLDQCWHFMFPIGGGRVLARKSSDFTNPRTPIGYHDLYQPRISEKKICICDTEGKRISERTRIRREAVIVTSTPNQKSLTPRKPNAMECTDIVVGSVLDGRGRVKDFYTPSKATPRPDSTFGGSDSLTAASAFREDGVTTVVFRRKLKAADKWDYSIDGPMTVIWAKGANPNNYQHTTGGAPIQADPKFFTKDSFKYHGRNQRGVLTIDFLQEAKKEKLIHGLHIDASTCSGSYTFPPDCSARGASKKCQYVIKWISDGEVARFNVKALIKAAQWIAIGFSSNGAMNGSDVIVIRVEPEKQVTITDQFVSNNERPVVDEQQDIFDVETSWDGDVLVANFSRELYSEDKYDIDLRKCVHLLFTPTANTIEPNGEIKKYEQPPISSETKVCLNTCSVIPLKTTEVVPQSTTRAIKQTTTTKPKRPIETSSRTTTKVLMPPVIKAPPPFVVFEPTEPIKNRYRLRVRILNKDYTPELSDPQTEYYQSFTKSVTSAINDLLAKRWKGMKVSSILGYYKGSVIAEFEVVSIDDVPRPIEIKSLLEENAIRGTIGDLIIEPSTIKASLNVSDTKDDDVREKAYVRNLVIIAGSSLLLIFAVLCTCCLLCRDSYPVQHTAPYFYGNGAAKTPAGFDNAAFHNHQRHYSQATTASTKPSATPPSTNEVDGPPGGIGETTYHEWYSKVGSKPASQQHEEAVAVTRPPSATPYVSYPSDPSGYYTLGGEHRSGSTSKHLRSPF